MIKYLGVFLLVIFLGACSEKVLTVDYYMKKENEAERLAKVEACRDLPDKNSIPNCVNAFNAKEKEDMRRMLNEGYPRA